MLLQILNTFLDADRWLLKKINSEWINPFFDSLLPFIREGNHWLPVYIFLAVFVLINFKNSGWWILFFVCTVALTDLSGKQLFKDVFDRLRPCADPDFMMMVRSELKACSGGFSFISNHAANHFGMATFIFFTLRSVITSRWLRFIFLWPAMVSYAQVYIGVHYPSDVICGGLWGFLIGYTVAWLFNKRYGIAIFVHQHNV